MILKEVKVRSNPNSDYSDPYAYDDTEDNEDVSSNSVEDILETVEKNENKLHVANYFEANPTPGSYGEFQCLAEKDKRILHSWQYRVLGELWSFGYVSKSTKLYLHACRKIQGHVLRHILVYMNFDC